MPQSKVVSIASGFHRARVRERRDALVTEHLSLVEGIARGILRNLPPSFELDDLIAAGNVALLHAATRYRPGAHNGTPFAPFARPAIRGAIIESVRRRHYTENTRPPIGDVETGADPTLDRDIDAARTAKRLHEAIGWLPPLQRDILQHYYRSDEPTLAEVAGRLNQRPQKTRQQHALALESLRRRLRPAA